jgi:hypothetical protein
MEPCLLCGKPATDDHHFPYTRRYGTATVPLCRTCHTDAHWGRHTERLIDLAPGYWKRVGEWEANAEAYERWCGRRRYLEAVR